MLVPGLGFALFLEKGPWATFLLLRIMPGAVSSSLSFPFLDGTILASLRRAVFRTA